ncbi:RAI1-domain-containing protein [Boletus reticuloceps]|uniref:Decapping nuclease n=1 Tax=Boletus reticuloceps TaxID=495285 RepID=A0A8I2YCF5_9AGAM|nr:RAI1-domain-containing protein [Boletus reticuloceps]
MAQKRKAADAELEDGPPVRKSPSSITLAYPSLSHSPSKPPPFQQPTQLLTFSYTPDHVLEFNDSALRYYIDPPLGADLGYGYDKWIRRPDERGRLDPLLQAWSRFKKGLCEGPSSSQSRAPDIHVRILIAPYEERDGWELNVMRVGGTLYFEEHLSEAKLKGKNEMEPRHRRQTYHGYAFESYCTTSTPGRREDDSSHVHGWGGDVNTNVQWCSVVKTKLGDRRIVIGGEVDCVREKYSGNTANFVELKTSLTIRGSADETKFEKKLLKFYLQSFLLGVPEIVVGFRKPSGQLVTTQSFRTVEIPRSIRGRPGAWDPLICLAWGDRFLSFLHDTLPANTGKDVWRVTLSPKVGIAVAKLDALGVEDVMGGDDRVGFLPRWYWDEMGLDADGSGYASAHRGESSQRQGTCTSGVPSGWRI